MEKGNRKVKMLQHTQALAFALVVLFMILKVFGGSGAAQLDNIVLTYGLAGVGANFAAFVMGNVKGDHKNDGVAG